VLERFGDPTQLTVRTVPEFMQDGDPWAGIDDTAGALDRALELWNTDVDNGLPELPFPPDFPKMPGEPKRVQPSKSRTDTSGIEPEGLYANPERWKTVDGGRWAPKDD